MVFKDPDVEVQERLELVFRTFLKLRTVAKVMRMLNHRNHDLPRRDRHGDLRWTRATVAAVSTILQNPAYAGAFVYGRTRIRAGAADGSSVMKVARPMEEWRIVVKDRYPSYIDWPTYEKIRSIVRDNRAEYMRIKTRGAPRDGDLLLHGIVWCGRCGHKMYVLLQGRRRVRLQPSALPRGLADMSAPARRAHRCGRGGCVPDGAGACRTRCPVARPAGAAAGRRDAGARRGAPTRAQALCRGSGRAPVQPCRSGQSPRRR
ncbi:recombinase family protein [Mycobacterium sp. KBS0706]|uniref:recombinase family protein n=1 Tax=Mycobacterium sp. KBS0706 TaxID=2578109 RepID=UPI0027D2B71F|nr:recombinase family protein [Mycobacterium sp. KBS0706]